MIARLSTNDIYDGCLAFLKPCLESQLPPNTYWVTTRTKESEVHGIQNLVGNPTPINEHQQPADNPPGYIKIFLEITIFNLFHIL